jgi:pimeloyl-ACP methyl ester carboxylesterase
MTTFVLIHGAGSDSWYWHLVEPELRARGHDVVAPDLPSNDDSAGLEEYADVVVDAIGDHRRLVLVAQSMGAFTAPLVCQRADVELMVLVAAMVPAPGEAPGEWWTNTGWNEARAAQLVGDGRPPDDFDPMADFLHDVPQALIDASVDHVDEQSDTPFQKPWPLDAWPDVPTRFLLCRDDRFFPAEFQRRVVEQRLGITPDEIDGGHLPALSRPVELADRLHAYATELSVRGDDEWAR